MPCHDLRINAPGAGEWIMAQSGGRYEPETSHSISAHYGSDILGGFVFEGYRGNSILVHNAGKAPGWCSRDLLWMVFDYAFRQLRVGKLIAPVASNNYRALAINLRAGYRPETLIADAIEPGVHLMILTMTAAECGWLKLSPQQYLPGR